MATETVAAASESPAPSDETEAAPQPAQEPEKAAGASEETADEGLLSEAELGALKDAMPEDRLKAYNRAFTQRMQAIAKERETLREQRLMLDALQNDPENTLKILAKQHGLEVAKSKDEQQVLDQTFERYKTLFGSEDVARQVMAVVQDTAKALVAPVQAKYDELIRNASLNEVENDMKAFEKAHPEWKKYEKAMTELSQKLRPNGMRTGEYMDTLYSLVTKDSQVAEATKRVVARADKSAAAAESPASGVSGEKVSHVMPDGLNLSQQIKWAHEQAKQGHTV